MIWRTTATTLLLAVLLASLGQPAPAQETPRFGSNAINDEPNFPSTSERGVPGSGFTQQGPGGATAVESLDASAQDPPPLVLESYYEYDAGVRIDLNQLANSVTHGDSYDEYDYLMYPGLGAFEAYFGWFADAGDPADEIPSGEDPLVTFDESADADGVIFDVWDKEADPRDEFVWHGRNPWASETNHPTHTGDDMFVFIQPGTHSLLGYDPSDGLVEPPANHDGEPDLRMVDETGKEDQEWSTRVPTAVVENSLLVATNVTTAANPPASGSGGRLNPTPDDGRFPGDQRYDVDHYQSLHPEVEALWRATVWDPGDKEDSPLDENAPEGLKVYTRETVVPGLEGRADALPNATAPDGSTQAGYADDRAGKHPYPHEPNEDGDVYPYAPDNSDATYGGLDTYYEPQPGAERYPLYERGEHLFADAHVLTSYDLLAGVAFGFHEDAPPILGCCSPGTDGTNLGAGEDDGRYSQPPGRYALDVNVGTWWDVNRDSFVGRPSGPFVEGSPRYPYANGTVDDPNDFLDNPTHASGEPQFEFRGTCGADVQAKIAPHNNDIDNDGRDEWGAPVYRVHNDPARNDPVFGGGTGLPYPEVVGDVTGGVGPVHDGDDEQLSQFRAVGDEAPIPLRVVCNTDANGLWRTWDAIVSPAGTIDHALQATTEVLLTDNRTARDAAGNGGETLQRERITDVDIVKAWETG